MSSGMRQAAFLALLGLCLPLGCDGEEDEADPLRDLAGFCRAWSLRVCTEAVVGACQATSVQACQERQSAHCQAVFGADPDASYQRPLANGCLEAVAAAYQDARLSREEFRLVQGTGEPVGPCATVVTGSGVDGAACARASDCDGTRGFVCLRPTPDATEGLCKVPVTRSGGQSCDRPEQSCAAGFYCDGRNCLEARGEGEACGAAVPCGDAFRCVSDVCAPRSARGLACTSDEECLSGLCVIGGAGGVCVESIVLSPAEPACAALR